MGMASSHPHVHVIAVSARVVHAHKYGAWWVSSIFGYERSIFPQPVNARMKFLARHYYFLRATEVVHGGKRDRNFYATKASRMSELSRRFYLLFLFFSKITVLLTCEISIDSPVDNFRCTEEVVVAREKLHCIYMWKDRSFIAEDRRYSSRPVLWCQNVVARATTRG